MGRDGCIERGVEIEFHSLPLEQQSDNSAHVYYRGMFVCDWQQQHLLLPFTLISHFQIQ